MKTGFEKKQSGRESVKQFGHGFVIIMVTFMACKTIFTTPLSGSLIGRRLGSIDILLLSLNFII